MAENPERSYLKPDDLKEISNLELLARLVVEGLSVGMHESPQKGSSVEFKQHRPYVSGDDIRHLDWKIYGRSDRFYIREYEEETNLHANILLDASGSMGYAGNETSKLEYGCRLAACLSYMLLQQQEDVGLVTYDDEIRGHIPPRSQVVHLKRIIDRLEQTEPGGETGAGDVFHRLATKIDQRGLLIIISDLFDDPQELISGLSHFRFEGHEVIIFQLLDRDEVEFPFDQWTRFENLEQVDDREMVDPAQRRKRYRERLEAFQEELRTSCHRHRIDFVEMVTDRPYAEALASYLAARENTS